MTRLTPQQLSLGEVAPTPGERRRYPTAPPPPTEHDEQAALLRWVRERATFDPAADALALLFAIPNGGDRHPAVARKLSTEGVAPGVPDLLLPVARQGYHGLFLELKRIRGGRLSPDQERWHAWLREQEYMVEVCLGAGAAIRVLCAYLGLEEQVDAALDRQRRMAALGRTHRAHELAGGPGSD